MLVIVIGKGHGGTRAASKTLSESGIYMGPTNDSGDLIPFKPMYEAVEMAGAYVEHIDEHRWDFSQLINTDPTEEFKQLVNEYIKPIQGHELKGWKLPETILAYPWIVKMFPDAYYIHWTRDPIDALLKKHVTDKLWRFGVPCNRESELKRRMGSWKYQQQIVEDTPRPVNYIHIAFEDFVMKQTETLDKLHEFLDIPMAKILVNPEAVGRYKNA